MPNSILAGNNDDGSAKRIKLDLLPANQFNPLIATASGTPATAASNSKLALTESLKEKLLDLSVGQQVRNCSFLTDNVPSPCSCIDKLR